jgi:hypothetical protein
MPIGPDFRYSQDVVATDPRQLAPQQPEIPAPSALQTLTAAARTTHVVGALYQRVTTPDPDMPDAPEGWDPLDNLPEDMRDDRSVLMSLMDKRTPSDFYGEINRIREERANRQVLERAGWGGIGSELLFTLVDPTFLAAAAVPESLLARGVLATRMRSAAAHGTLGAGFYEGSMQAIQEDRSIATSALNVAGGALVSGVLGRYLNRIPGEELAPITQAINEEISAVSTAGAAAVRTGDIAGETIAPGGAGLSKVISKTPLIATDLDVIMNAESAGARQALQAIADVPQAVAKNQQGVASTVTMGGSDVAGSAENAVSRHEARVANFVDQSGQEWKKYSERVPKGTPERLSKTEFFSAIARASRSGDTIGIPEVDAAAQSLRREVFEPLWNDAKLLGLYEDPVKAAQERATKRAVGKYVRAETRQQYATYRATKNAAAGRGKFMRQLDEELENPTTPALQAINDIDTQIADVADRARQGLSTVEQVRAVGISKAAALRAEAAQRFEQTMAKLETPKAQGGAATFGWSQVRLQLQNAREELTRALEVIRTARGRALEGADAAGRVRANAQARALSTKLRTEFKAQTEKLRTELRESVAAARLAAKSGETKALRAAARKQVTAARKFERELASAREAARGEQRLAKETARKIRAEAAAERKALRDTKSKLREKEYEKFAGPNRPLTRRRFVKEAASSRGAQSKDPQIQAVAKLLRDQRAGALTNRVTVPRVDPRYVQKLLADKSYFTRMYDRELIRANRAQWEQLLTDWFTRSGDADAAEIAAAVHDVTEKILGNDIGLANFASRISTPAAGPLKDRTLDIPSNMIEQFLVNDPIKAARAYVRELAPQVELARRGLDDEGMKQVLGSIGDEYAVKIENAKASIKDPKKLNKEIDRLSRAKMDTQEALLRVRNRVMGRAGLVDPSAGRGVRLAVQAARGWRNIVASTRLGGTAMTGGLMDLAKVTAQYGFAPTMSKLTKLATSKTFRDYARKQGRRAGAVIEVALAKRVQAAYEGAITEGWTDKLAHGVYKWTGLNHIMDFNRTLQASLFEDEILKQAAKVAKGTPLSRYKRTRLASMGLGDAELQEIAAEVAEHGGTMDGVRISGSAMWSNKLLADKYDAAILKDSHVTVQQPGAADRVWWMDKETGRLIGQLKSFALSAPTRLLSGGLQMAGQGAHLEAARFFGFMLIGGYLTHALRSTVAGRKPKTSPGTAFNEALTESGMLGILPDIVSPPLRLFGKDLGLQASARYSDSNVFSAYGGPALGQVQDVWSVLPRVADGKFSQADIHALRRTFVPGQNVWMFRRAINALEGELGEAIGAEGSTPGTFASRVMEVQE